MHAHRATMKDDTRGAGDEPAPQCARAVDAVLYARPSATSPDVRAQLRSLAARAQSSGWHIVAELTDEPRATGVAARDRRPGFDHALRALRTGGAATLAVESVDVIARSLADLKRTLSILSQTDCRLVAIANDLDTDLDNGTAFTTALSHILSSARAAAATRGHQQARAAGRRVGAPRVAEHVAEEVRRLRAEGNGILKTAKLAGVGVGTVQRIDAETRGDTPT